MQATDTPVALRAFGRREDLDLDFAGSDRPGLVTALLAHCSGQEAACWWPRTVGERMAALLAVYRHSEGVDEVELAARCVNPECGETFGFELPLAALVALAPADPAWTVALPDGRSLQLHAPTGLDLRRWRAAHPSSRQAALQLMLADLAPGQDLSPDDEQALSDALAERDPLVSLRADARCPACGRKQQIAVDLEGLVLNRFSARRRALLGEIHQLARHYGWTEDQVLALPAARRAEYLALIEGATA